MRNWKFDTTVGVTLTRISAEVLLDELLAEGNMETLGRVTEEFDGESRFFVITDDWVGVPA